MTMALPNHVQPDVQAVAGEIPMPLLGLTIAWTWLVVAGVSSLCIQWLRLDIYTMWHVRVPAAALGVVIATAFPLFLVRIPWVFRKRALPFFIPAGIMWVGLTIFDASTWINQIGVAITLVLYGIGWVRLRGRPPVAVLVTAAVPILWGLMYYFSPGVLWNVLHSILGDTVLRSVIYSMAWVAILQVLPVGVPLLIAGFAKPMDPAVEAVPRATYEARLDSGSLVVSRGTNGLAIASMVLGLVGGSVLAVVFGHVARSQIRSTREDGDGLAVAGLVLGYLGLAASLAAVLFIFFSNMR